MSTDDFVWVFCGEESHFPAAVFTSLAKAEEWITVHRLSGVLTAYPLDVGVYDWAIAKGYLKLGKEFQLEPAYIQKFSTASQEHYHYSNGVCGYNREVESQSDVARIVASDI